MIIEFLCFNDYKIGIRKASNMDNNVGINTFSIIICFNVYASSIVLAVNAVSIEIAG